MSRMSMLAVWYARIDTSDLLLRFRSLLDRRRTPSVWRAIHTARAHDSHHAFDNLCRPLGGEPRIVHDPPLIVPVENLLAAVDSEVVLEEIRAFLVSYYRTLPHDRRQLLDQYRLVRLRAARAEPRAPHRPSLSRRGIDRRCGRTVASDRVAAASCWSIRDRLSAPAVESHSPKWRCWLSPPCVSTSECAVTKPRGAASSVAWRDCANGEPPGAVRERVSPERDDRKVFCDRPPRAQPERLSDPGVEFPSPAWVTARATVEG